MNVFWRELKTYRKSTFIWIASLSATLIVFLLMYTAFSKDVETSRSLLAQFPPAVRSAFDISMSNFFTIYGFFAYLFTFIGLVGAVQAMNLGVGALSREESGKTVDFLLSKPVSRTKIVTAKLVAILVLIFITNIVFSAVALIMAKLVSTTSFDNNIFLLLTGELFLIQLFFVALGLLISVLTKRIKSSIAVVLPTVFTFFFVGTIGTILGLDEIKYFIPFKFFDSNYIIAHGSYDLQYLAIDLIFVVATIAASYLIYIRKDIRAAA